MTSNTMEDIGLSNNIKCKCGGVKVTTNELDYIAYRLAEFLDERKKNPPKTWVSQNKAYQLYGGRAFVQRLRWDRKVRTRKVCNRIEYYVEDLAKHLTPKAAIVQNRKYNKKNRENG